MTNTSKSISQIDIAADGTLVVTAKVNGESVFYNLDQDTMFIILELQGDKIGDKHSTDSRSPNYEFEK